MLSTAWKIEFEDLDFAKSGLGKSVVGSRLLKVNIKLAFIQCCALHIHIKMQT